MALARYVKGDVKPDKLIYGMRYANPAGIIEFISSDGVETFEIA
jgi:hypothetical protein